MRHVDLLIHKCRLVRQMRGLTCPWFWMHCDTNRCIQFSDFESECCRFRRSGRLSKFSEWPQQIARFKGVWLIVFFGKDPGWMQ